MPAVEASVICARHGDYKVMHMLHRAADPKALVLPRKVDANGRLRLCDHRATHRPLQHSAGAYGEQVGSDDRLLVPQDLRAVDAQVRVALRRQGRTESSMLSKARPYN